MVVEPPCRTLLDFADSRGILEATDDGANGSVINRIQGIQDELSLAKATILQLQNQLSQSQEQYLSVVKKYNKLVDDISRIVPAHIET